MTDTQTLTTQLQEKCEAFCLDESNWAGKWRGRSPKGRANFRLIYSPPETFNAPSRVMILGTNPGGRVTDADRNDAWLPFGPPSYSAYVHESWGGYDEGCHPIQRNVKNIAKALSGTSVAGKMLLKQIPTGNLIPFRSSSYPGTLTTNLIEIGIEYGLELIRIADPTVLILISSRQNLWNAVMRSLGHSDEPDWFRDLTPPNHDSGQWLFREASLLSSSRRRLVWALPALNSTKTDARPILSAFRSRLQEQGIRI